MNCFVFNAFGANTIEWKKVDVDGSIKIPVYFVWSQKCPHCKEAHPFLDGLVKQYPWIELHTFKIGDPGTEDTWRQLAQMTHSPNNAVPFIALCGKAIIGYSSDEVTGKYLTDKLKSCYENYGGTLNDADTSSAVASAALDDGDNIFATCSADSESDCGSTDTNNADSSSNDVQPVDLPMVGVISPDEVSLPLLTLVLAGVDAFNPCAFFVLLFLLSIMVNAKSKRRMLLVGGIFVFFSGFIYFLFMTAWLNIFQLLGADSDGGTIILVAGILALVAGVINVKEYFLTKGDVSLSMTAEHRTSLIKRMGKLSSASSLATMIASTTILAILANAYELLCTAGFPMIYTSVLSMHNLPSLERIMYLVFYNVVYVIPLLAIVIAFSMTLGKRKLTEKEGQALKLMSGIMMLGLGGMLAFNPTALQSVSLAIGLIVTSIVLTVIIVTIRKFVSK
ncbi:cytochrome C biosynthesis protein [Shewanella mangrovi]|uniref:cytochrome C biosynthesis protein n=1 Tax=Shewanella mangrovi TaxID=1515746 RepID=UPI003D3259BA